jgi:hypothetical protein
MRHLRTILATLTILIAGLAGSIGTAAQEASPPASPAANGCTVAPRPADELIPLWFGPDGTPAATPMPSSPAASEADLPQGEPADADTIAAITAVAQQVIACANAGEYGRWFALFTDHAAAQLGPEPGQTEADARAFLTTPQPVPAGEREAFVDLSDIRVLPDGRVGALLDVEGEPPTFVYFVQQDGQWLVDDLIFLPGEATPAA